MSAPWVRRSRYWNLPYNVLDQQCPWKRFNLKGEGNISRTHHISNFTVVWSLRVTVWVKKAAV
jgi:hypothetical protein